MSIFPLSNCLEFREKSHSVDFNNINDPILSKIVFKEMIDYVEKMDETKILLEEDERVHSISCGALHTLIKTGKPKLFSKVLIISQTRIDCLLVVSEKHTLWEMVRQRILLNSNQLIL